MTIQQAHRSGKFFKRKKWRNWWKLTSLARLKDERGYICFGRLSLLDILANDYIVKR